MIVLALFIIVMTVATAWDIRTRRVPNWLVFPALAGALVLAPWGPAGGYGEAFAGAGLAFGALCVLHLFGLGAGDVKVGAFIGAVLGAPALVAIALALVIAGAVAMYVGRKRLRASLPFVPFLSAGVVIVGAGQAMLWRTET